MSTNEIQEIIYRLGQFIFRGGTINEGMVVARYNIRDAKIEYYFVPTSNLNEYKEAKNKHETNAQLRFGNIIDVNSIIQAKLFN